jgi:hypothetical protein
MTGVMSQWSGSGDGISAHNGARGSLGKHRKRSNMFSPSIHAMAPNDDPDARVQRPGDQGHLVFVNL